MVIENRIEINGVWYVREDAINDSLGNLETEEMDLIFSEECVYETDKYSFVASRIRRGGSSSGEFYPDITIEFTDKRSGDRDTWKEDYWDNNNWFKGIIEGKAESIVSLDEETNICPQGKKQLKGFLNRLVEVGWLI
jgi:hypothetical protein